LRFNHLLVLVGPHPHSLLLLGSQTRSSQRPQALSTVCGTTYFSNTDLIVR
jgi:hypothetical protein